MTQDLNAEWQFYLVVSETMERLGELSQARDRSVQIVHNRPGGIGFTLPIGDDLFADAEPIKHGILATRNDIPKWSGMIWTIDEQLPSNRIGVSGVGWFETLNRRVLRQDVTYPRFNNPPLTIKGGEIVFADPVGTPGTAAYHPGGLLTQANEQRDTWISEGSMSDVMDRVITYSKGQSIGAAITELSDTEAGFDFKIDPLSRQMNITNWDEYPDKTDTVVFGYEWGPGNLSGLARQLDASVLANRVTAVGKFGSGLAEDLPSQQEFQLFEEIAQLSDVVDPNILLGYAGSEVILRSVPRTTYTIQPFPWVQGRTPEPFVDYEVGDMVSFSALRPPRVSISGQAVRVFGMSVNITNEGNEKLQALQVVPG